MRMLDHDLATVVKTVEPDFQWERLGFVLELRGKSKLSMMVRPEEVLSFVSSFNSKDR